MVYKAGHLLWRNLLRYAVDPNGYETKTKRRMIRALQAMVICHQFVDLLRESYEFPFPANL